MVTANVEKTIFVAPRPGDPRRHAELEAFTHLQALSPSSPVLEARLPVHFPTTTAPRGLEYWYLLEGLEQGRRYEVRICWPATVCFAVSSSAATRSKSRVLALASSALFV